MEFLKFSLSGFDDFLVYFGLAILFVIAFLWIYMLVTPYDEIKLIRAGNAAAAWSLGFTLLGFSFPLASAIVHSVNPWDMMLWALIALVVQILVFVVVRLLLPDVTRRIEEGQVATGAFLGLLSLAAGVLNAASMTY
jgi:putative membrane protein